MDAQIEKLWHDYWFKLKPEYQNIKNIIYTEQLDVGLLFARLESLETSDIKDTQSKRFSAALKPVSSLFETIQEQQIELGTLIGKIKGARLSPLFYNFSGEILEIKLERNAKADDIGKNLSRLKDTNVPIVYLGGFNNPANICWFIAVIVPFFTVLFDELFNSNQEANFLIELQKIINDDIPFVSSGKDAANEFQNAKKRLASIELEQIDSLNQYFEIFSKLLSDFFMMDANSKHTFHRNSIKYISGVTTPKIDTWQKYFNSIGQKDTRIKGLNDAIDAITSFFTVMKIKTCITIQVTKNMKLPFKENYNIYPTEPLLTIPAVSDEMNLIDIDYEETKTQTINNWISIVKNPAFLILDFSGPNAGFSSSPSYSDVPNYIILNDQKKQKIKAIYALNDYTPIAFQLVTVVLTQPQVHYVCIIKCGDKWINNNDGFAEFIPHRYPYPKSILNGSYPKLAMYKPVQFDKMTPINIRIGLYKTSLIDEYNETMDNMKRHIITPMEEFFQHIIPIKIKEANYATIEDGFAVSEIKEINPSEKTIIVIPADKDYLIQLRKETVPQLLQNNHDVITNTIFLAVGKLTDDDFKKTLISKPTDGRMTVLFIDELNERFANSQDFSSLMYWLRIGISPNPNRLPYKIRSPNQFTTKWYESFTRRK